ncbi:MAG: ATP-grasp protein [Patescibacteria group bacterium]|nr:ATP-grasp protein [Patescibacteria group bacterium]
MPREIKKKTVAVLRGGKEDYHKSMKSGANIILSLFSFPEEISVIDVAIDEDGNWFERGIPSDTHKVFSQADYYIDLTKDYNGSHHNLSKKLNIKQILENDFHRVLSRVNVRRILDQLGYETPKYVVLRDSKNLENNLKILWSKFHMPVVIKEGDNTKKSKSLLTYSFLEAYKKIKEIVNSGGEAILEEHLEGEYISIAAIPNYRGEALYFSIPIETIHVSNSPRVVQGKTIKDKYLIDHNHHKRSLTHMDSSLKKKLKGIIEEIHTSLSLDHHIMLDLCLKKKDGEYNIKILELHTNPHLFDDSRFDFILRNSGIDMGKFILGRIENLEEGDKIY